MRISVTVSAAPPLALPPELKKYKARRLLDEAGQRALSAVWQAAGAAGLDLTVHSPTRAVIVSAAAY
ncbi:MAG: hypothetical protein LBK71_05615, partial [Verrucomicrobiales bacterium]|nr:hypothetical protein [Verrucomicrobiales bacterium]